MTCLILYVVGEARVKCWFAISEFFTVQSLLSWCFLRNSPLPRVLFGLCGCFVWFRVISWIVVLYLEKRRSTNKHEIHEATAETGSTMGRAKKIVQPIRNPFASSACTHSGNSRCVLMRNALLLDASALPWVARSFTNFPNADQP